MQCLLACFLIIFAVNGFTKKSDITKAESIDFTKIQDQLKNNPMVNNTALGEAIHFYQKNDQQKKFSKKYLAIADFTQPSTKKRLMVLHLPSGQVEFYKVAHGKGSDKNHDLKFDQFLSKPGSNGTPAGFHKMTTTYHGKHGLSLKMEGLESHNKTSMKRAIVLHGADYVSWSHTGRSLGCPAVEKQYHKSIIEKLKGGALVYHFYKKDRSKPKRYTTFERH